MSSEDVKRACLRSKELVSENLFPVALAYFTDHCARALGKVSGLPHAEESNIVASAAIRALRTLFRVQEAAGAVIIKTRNIADMESVPLVNQLGELNGAARTFYINLLTCMPHIAPPPGTPSASASMSATAPASTSFSASASTSASATQGSVKARTPRKDPLAACVSAPVQQTDLNGSNKKSGSRGGNDAGTNTGKSNGQQQHRQHQRGTTESSTEDDVAAVELACEAFNATASQRKTACANKEDATVVEGLKEAFDAGVMNVWLAVETVLCKAGIRGSDSMHPERVFCEGVTFIEQKMIEEWKVAKESRPARKRKQPAPPTVGPYTTLHAAMAKSTCLYKDSTSAYNSWLQSRPSPAAAKPARKIPLGRKTATHQPPPAPSPSTSAGSKAMSPLPSPSASASGRRKNRSPLPPAPSPAPPAAPAAPAAAPAAGSATAAQALLLMKGQTRKPSAKRKHLDAFADHEVDPGGLSKEKILPSGAVRARRRPSLFVPTSPRRKAVAADECEWTTDHHHVQQKLRVAKWFHDGAHNEPVRITANVLAEIYQGTVILYAPESAPDANDELWRVRYDDMDEED